MAKFSKKSNMNDLVYKLKSLGAAYEAALQY